MNNKRYEISIEELAFSFSGGSRTENEIIEMYYKESTHDPEVVGKYATKEEAYNAWEKEFKGYAETKEESGNGSLKYLRCKVALMDEIECDEDGEEVGINPMEMAVEPFRDLEDVLEQMKKKNGFFIDEYNDTYILTQQAYIDGPVDAPYFTAMAINENEGTDSFGLFPVYEVVWYPIAEWLAGDQDDEGDACNWDKPDEITENCGGWDPEDGRII